MLKNAKIFACGALKVQKDYKNIDLGSVSKKKLRMPKSKKRTLLSRLFSRVSRFLELTFFSFFLGFSEEPKILVFKNTKDFFRKAENLRISRTIKFQKFHGFWHMGSSVAHDFVRFRPKTGTKNTPKMVPLRGEERGGYPMRYLDLSPPWMYVIYIPICHWDSPCDELLGFF